MYTMEHRVRYSETDAKHQAKIYEILNYFQDCSLFHSEDIGQGLKPLAAKKRAWLLSGWQVEIHRCPVFGEEILVHTWPYEFKTFFGYRNFVICTKSGEKLVQANSIWFFTDMEKAVPVRPEEDDVEGYILSPKEDMVYLPRKIAIPKEYEEAEPFTVTRNMIDSNHHMNNEQYIEFALSYLPEGYEIHHLRADYRKETKLGETLIPQLTKTDTGYVIVMRTIDGECHVILQLDA